MDADAKTWTTNCRNPHCRSWHSALARFRGGYFATVGQLTRERQRVALLAQQRGEDVGPVVREREPPARGRATSLPLDAMLYIMATCVQKAAKTGPGLPGGLGDRSQPPQTTPPDQKRGLAALPGRAISLDPKHALVSPKNSGLGHVLPASGCESCRARRGGLGGASYSIAACDRSGPTRRLRPFSRWAAPCRVHTAANAVTWCFPRATLRRSRK